MRPLDPQFVLDAVCFRYDFTRDDLAGPLRSPRLVLARWLAFYVLHEHANLSYPQIARLVRRHPWFATSVCGAAAIRKALAGDGQVTIGVRSAAKTYDVRTELYELLEFLGAKLVEVAA